jgi:hypothetical protein
LRDKTKVNNGENGKIMPICLTFKLFSAKENKSDDKSGHLLTK